MKLSLQLAAALLMVPAGQFCRGEEFTELPLTEQFQTLAFHEDGEEIAATSELTLASACESCSAPADECGGGCCVCESPSIRNWAYCQLASGWTARAGAVILHRDHPKDAPLIRNIAGTADLFNARNFDFGWEGGVDATLMRTFDGGANAIESRFFGVNDWTATQTFTAPASWQLPGAAPVSINGGGPAAVNFNYDSRLYSAELNWRHRMNYYFDWLAGFRWVQVAEDLRYSTNIGVPLSVNFNTSNNLYGGQLGGDMRLWGFNNNRPFFGGTVFKAGIFGNDAWNQSNVRLLGNNLLAANDNQGQLAFVGELDFVAGYRWNDHVALRSGYQLLWLEGVALASEQISATNLIAGNGINANGDPFYHGVLTSLDITW